MQPASTNLLSCGSIFYKNKNACLVVDLVSNCGFCRFEAQGARPAAADSAGRVARGAHPRGHPRRRLQGPRPHQGGGPDARQTGNNNLFLILFKLQILFFPQ